MRTATAALICSTALSLAVVPTADAEDRHRLARVCERGDSPSSADPGLHLRATLSTLVPTLYGRVEHNAGPAHNRRRVFAGKTETVETHRLLLGRSRSIEWEIGLRWNLLSALSHDTGNEEQSLDERTEAVEDFCAELAAARRRSTAAADDRLRDLLAEELAERKLEAVESDL